MEQSTASIPWYSNCCSTLVTGIHEEHGTCPRCEEHCEFERYGEDGEAIETHTP